MNFFFIYSNATQLNYRTTHLNNMTRDNSLKGQEGN